MKVDTLQLLVYSLSMSLIPCSCKDIVLHDFDNLQLLVYSLSMSVAPCNCKDIV